MKLAERKPWAFLDAWRGTAFTGEWPTLPEMFRITVERFPDRPCFTSFDPDRVSLTYREALAKIETLAAWLQSQGVRKGDHVAVSGKNSPEWAVVYLATVFAGATIIPIDYGLHDPEIENLLRTAEPKLFFVDEEKFAHFSVFLGSKKVYSLNKAFPEVYAYNLKGGNLSKIVPPVE
ncbi:MAG TPA: AMP-binding protein, partial [Treponemataceae bacterium]|nr:AMP-binding protein [Treponemataceae bacterium]